MNFFEHQDRARRNTSRLVLFFAMAVIGIIAAVYVVALAVVNMHDHSNAPEGQPLSMFTWVWWRPEVLGLTALGTTMVIAFGSAMKIAQLSGGGGTVAQLMGGRIVPADSGGAGEKRLRNAVEEMAIASGIPVPQIYVMDFEEGINAFAAGFSPNDAAVCVSRGCLSVLTRDELQGVVAHEFSHILNGDMRLNIRLIGVLNGILIIGMLGEVMFRSFGRTSSSRSKRDGNAAAGIMLLGAGLWIIGSIGVLFGRLIKAAVSRQREFLADASAVQFTRNPEGIAGALKKIGGFSKHSVIDSPRADEVSHMFFGDAKERWLTGGSPFATHPPLDERIRRIDPHFQGEYGEVTLRPRGDEEESSAAVSAFAGGERDRAALSATAERANAGGVAVRARPAEVLQRVGTSVSQQTGARILGAMPDDVRRGVGEPYGAVVTTLALLMNDDDSPRQAQLECIRAYGEAAMVTEVQRVLPRLAELPPQLRLPLVDLALPALRQLSEGQYRDFYRVAEELIRADEQMTLYEFSIGLVLRHALESAFEPRAQKIEVYSFASLAPHLSQLLSTLAYAGARDAAAAQAAYRAGIARIQNARAQQTAMLARAECRPEAIEKAVRTLAVTAPALRQQVFDACAHCVLADQNVTAAEAELLRAFAHAMDCPLPPFLALEGG